MIAVLLLAVSLVHAQTAPAAPPVDPGSGGLTTLPVGEGTGIPTGLVVRLNAGSQKLSAPVVVKLTPEDGTTYEVPLNDEGTQPDVAAGDGMWSGSALVPGDTASVTLSAGAVSASNASVSLASDKERNLDLVLSGTKLEVGTPATAPATPPTGTATGVPPIGATPTGAITPGGVPTGGPLGTTASLPPPVNGRAGGNSDAKLYIALGIGGLLLAAIGYLWFRGPKRGGALPKGVRRVPEVGHFGAGTPALTPGLSQWVVASADEADLLRSLVAHVAPARAIFVKAPEDVDLPPIKGGPVFRAACAKPAALAEAVDDLLEPHPGLVVIMIAEAGPELARWTRDLVEDVPVFALVRDPTEGEGQIVTCQRTPQGWMLRMGGTTVLLAEPAAPR